MMTNHLAQIAGEPARQAPQDGDETDPEALAARAAAELPAGFVWGAAISSYQSSGRWYSTLMRAHRSAGDPT